MAQRTIPYWKAFVLVSVRQTDELLPYMKEKGRELLHTLPQ